MNLIIIAHYGVLAECFLRQGSTSYYESFFTVVEQDCGNIQIVQSAFVPCGVPTCLDVPPGGDYWVFVAANAFGANVGCAWRYNLEATGATCPPVSVEPVTWGEIKGHYR